MTIPQKLNNRITIEPGNSTSGYYIYTKEMKIRDQKDSHKRKKYFMSSLIYSTSSSQIHGDIEQNGGFQGLGEGRNGM